MLIKSTKQDQTPPLVEQKSWYLIVSDYFVTVAASSLALLRDVHSFLTGEVTLNSFATAQRLL
jgi:hypothetical protein